MPTDIHIDWDSRQMMARLREVNPKVQKACLAALKFQEPRILAYARQNAPWTDRTSNARNGLFTTVQHDAKTFVLTLSHGVPYGIWLEVRFSGRFAIIRPTIDAKGPEVFATAKRLITAELGR
jgi:hypothetical protein